MRQILIYGTALLALSACGPAKMGTRNDKRGQQPASKPETASTPLKTEQPTASVENSPQIQVDPSKTIEIVTTEPMGSGVPVMPEPKAKIYDPGSDTTEATCTGNDCNENFMTDAGNFKTEQDFQLTPMTQKLDVVFILDTSKSMRDEHEKISREMSDFIAKLSPEVSIRIGVMLAHGPGTGAKGVKVGYLFYRGSELPVIDSEDVLREVKRDSRLVMQLQQQGIQGIDLEKHQRQQAAARISEIMKVRLANLPNDRSKAQGEAGLLNLYKALTGAAEKAALKRAGILRDDAALLVVFAADEQDMCFDYSQPSLVTGKIHAGSYDKPIDETTEKAAFASNEICGRVTQDGQRLTPKHVFDAVKSAKGEMPIIITGIHYLDEERPDANDQHAGDNEMGHGYLDLIKLANGRAVNLKTEDFGNVLAEIGTFSNAKMKFEKNSFEIPGNVDPKRFEPKSVGVIIKTADGTQHPVDGANVETRNNEKTGRPEIVIKHEALEFIKNQGWSAPGTKLVIYYGYKD